MNIQAMMKQAQKLQSDMGKVKKELDETLYNGKSGIVEIEIYGNLNVNKVNIHEEDLTDVDKEMLEDMINISLNQCLEKIKNDKESKLGQFGQGMQGLL